MTWYDRLLSDEGRVIKAHLEDMTIWYRSSGYEMWPETRDHGVFLFDINYERVWVDDDGTWGHAPPCSPYALWISNGMMFFQPRLGNGTLGDVLTGDNVLSAMDKFFLYRLAMKRLKLEKTKEVLTVRKLKGQTEKWQT